MNRCDREGFVHRVMSGEDRSLRAMGMRGVLALAEPVYAGVMSLRNAGYDKGVLRAHRLGRPTISVGNLTAGGTGKTPVVRWLAEQLRQRGLHPAILLRGYRATQSGSDEQTMLQAYLPGAQVMANPDRIIGARSALDRAPATDLFILDDGFQHRRAHRDFDLALISAAEPFGYGHVLPRGLLREPKHGLSRADAIVITRAEQVSIERLNSLRERLAKLTSARLYTASHRHVGLRSSRARISDPTDFPMDELRTTRFFAFSGIGDVGALFRQLQSYGATLVGTRGFPDHHAFTASDLSALRDAARAVGAAALVTTEKDWVKLADLDSSGGTPPIWRLELEIEFERDHAERLLEQIMSRIGSPSAAARSAP